MHIDRKKEDGEWSDFDWHDIVPRLSLYAIGLIRRNNNSIDYSIVEDLVYSAINKTISGERKWSREKVDLFGHLAGAVRSEFSNEINKKRKTVAFEGKKQIELLNNLKSKEESPHDVCFFKKQAEEFILELAKHDDQLARMAILMIEQEETSSIEISNYMKISIKEVNNLKKRLKRKLKEFLLIR